MAPVLRSASIAICLPGIASSVNLAVTSATRSEPLLIIISCTIKSMINTITPITRSLPATKEPKALTTLPGLPVLRISFVEDTLSAILKIVVKRSIEGNACISSTSLEYNAVKRIMNATVILMASITSSKPEGSVIKRQTIAANKYMPIIISVFFIFLSPSCNYYILCLTFHTKARTSATA